MSKSEKVLEAQLKQQIDDARTSLSATMEALAHEAQPAVQIEYAKQSVRDRVDQFKQDCQDTVEAARHGDREAIKRVLIAAGAVAAAGVATGFCVARQTRRARERREWRRFVRQLRKVHAPGSVEFSIGTAQG
ncbi:DUF3618 domain-containing protein [Scrofimicrobium sp. R131]|uniref:DUF3618 domain-containing protein n=1 Tax=Scrofimicrobium appendicitidis TaxID=3079930 RepID=A0AAU7V7W4_9ACTO